MNLEICPCDYCQLRKPVPARNFNWVGDCSCNGQDKDCALVNDNWEAYCPECGGILIAEDAPSPITRKYGHTTWACDSRSCGWWWG